MKRTTALLALAFALRGAAQSVPPTLNYQGRLTDNTTQQNPVSSAVPMQFAIYDDVAAGTRLWREPDTDGGSTPVTVSGGVFSVVLGGNGTPLPVPVFSGGAQRWLEITVNGETLAPRQRISATGYANQAENAASAVSALNAASATTAVTAATSTNSLQLGGVSAGGYQLATSAACGSNQFVSSIAASGATSCGTPQTLIPLPLILSGGDAGPLVHVTQTGAGQGLWSDVTTGPSAAVLGNNTGLGKGGSFLINNPGNASPAIYAYTNGLGDGVFAVSTAHNGVGGSTASTGDSGIYGENTGLGRAGYFRNVNTASAAATLAAYNNNNGPAIHGFKDGTGPAGLFEVNNPANTGAALEVFNNGAGTGARVIAYSADPGSSALLGMNYGSGSAAKFTSGSDPASLAETLYVVNTGKGGAGYFQSGNGASTAPTLLAENDGSGPTGLFRSRNVQSIPLFVDTAYAGQTAKLQSWNVDGVEVASLSPAGVFAGSGAGLTQLNPANLASGTANIDISGSAASVPFAVYTYNIYPDPGWIGSLAGTKITGFVANAASASNAATVTNGIYTTGSYANPAWISSLAGAKITGTVASATSAVSAATVTNGVYTTGSYADPVWLTSIAGSKISGAVATATSATSATNATTVTNGVYTTGSYGDPAWITSLAGSKISGAVATAASATNAGNATTVTNGIYTTGSYSDPAWITGLAGSKITGSVASATSAGNATTVSNGVYTTGSYSDPAWIISFEGTKISGTVASAANSAQLGLVDAANWQRSLGTAACAAGSYYTAISQSGVASCANAQASLTAPLALSGNSTGAILSGGNSGLGIGVSGTATVAAGTSYGVEGTNASTSGAGVYGLASASNGNGVIGEANNGASAYGVWGKSTTGFAGNFTGKVNISGNLSVTGTLSKGGGSFKIDHPLDPANKYLYHSFVESPDMMNIYNGNVVTGADSEAVIELPDWFGALNRDFRYQLTVIGEFAQAIVGKEIEGNRFTIRTSKPGVKVSWQVTGIRQDAFANAHRIPVEEKKPDAERGTYLHPVENGQPAEKAAGDGKQHALEVR